MRKEVVCLLAFGIILFMIGLVATFYTDKRYATWTYPYQRIGLILVLCGIILTSLSLLLSLKKGERGIRRG